MVTIPELPLRQDVVIYQGATFRRHWRWKPGGVPMNFTGWSGRMQVRPRKGAAAVLLTLTTENGGIVLTTGGDVKLYATDEQTTTIDRSGVYDLKLKGPGGGDVIPFAEGKAILSHEVST